MDDSLELRLKAYLTRISELENEVLKYKTENERLERENELLHETAWEMYRKVRTLEHEREEDENLKKY